MSTPTERAIFDFAKGIVDKRDLQGRGYPWQGQYREMTAKFPGVRTEPHKSVTRATLVGQMLNMVLALSRSIITLDGENLVERNKVRELEYKVGSLERSLTQAKAQQQVTFEDWNKATDENDALRWVITMIRKDSKE